jgi:hypothetical protein
MKKSLFPVILAAVLFSALSGPAPAAVLYDHVNHRGSIYPFELSFGLGLPQFGSTTAPITYSGKPLSLGLGLRTDIMDNLAHVSGGIVLRTKTSDVQLNYLYLNFGYNLQELYFVDLGVNFPFWSTDNLTVNGRPGFEAGFGAYMGNMSMFSLKGVFFNGGGQNAGSDFTISLNSVQLCFTL